MNPIKTADRLPTREDASPDGNVWGYMTFYVNEVFIAQWFLVDFQAAAHRAYWLPYSAIPLPEEG